MFARALLLSAAFALVAAGCGEGSAMRDGAVAGEPDLPPLPPTDALDLLFVIDDSGPMTEEQESLAEVLPALVRGLLAGRGPGGLTFGAVRSLQVGVVSTDLGTGEWTQPGCEDGGEDGLLLTRPGLGEGCGESYPPILAFDAPSDASPDALDAAAEALAADLRCLTQAGVLGCRFVQPLEAMLKALTPASSALRFEGDQPGQGAGGANDGFLREGAALAIVILTHADDCSTTTPDLFAPPTATGFFLRDPRCFRHPEALHPLERYVEGLFAVADPRRLAVVTLAGLPPALAPVPGAPPDFEGMLADPAMEARIDPDQDIRLAPSCNPPGRGRSFPPRRLVGFAQALTERGASASVQSLCERDFSGALDDLLRRIAVAVGG